MIKTKEKKHILYEIRQNLETIVCKNADYTQELCLVLNKMAKLALGEINSNCENIPLFNSERNTPSWAK